MGKYQDEGDCVIHWFRQDLRLGDNPSLHQAVLDGCVLPIYIHDEVNVEDAGIGAASKWWLHHSLTSLNKQLDGRLSVYRGDPLTLLPALAQRLGISKIHWNRCYEPWRISRDKKLKIRLRDVGIETRSHNGSLLWEPWDISKGDGTPYRVFGPFFKNGCLKAPPPRSPITTPEPASYIGDSESLRIEDLGLRPSKPWDGSLSPHWTIGEDGAQQRLQAFLAHGLGDYKEGRNFAARTNVSRLSPHLHFGELSPNQAWYAVQADETNAEHFLSELGWREFSYHLLYQFPDLPKACLQQTFNAFPWKTDARLLQAWQQGKTGYPIVDAGMRELWQTGYMHNRVRMIVASFLVKNLLLHWHHGAAWFWDCLVDADLANNSASWQWVAGCGADAAPYFRIFNPVTQGQKFDAEGDYTRRYLPELSRLPNKYLFNPWEAPPSVLSDAGVALGTHYPSPVVDLKASRKRALNALAVMKTNPLKRYST